MKRINSNQQIVIAMIRLRHKVFLKSSEEVWVVSNWLLFLNLCEWPHAHLHSLWLSMHTFRRKAFSHDHTHQSSTSRSSSILRSPLLGEVWSVFINASIEALTERMSQLPKKLARQLEIVRDSLIEQFERYLGPQYSDY